jgi:glycosyltransferase involved in cell wall biosynthesis
MDVAVVSAVRETDAAAPRRVPVDVVMPVRDEAVNLPYSLASVVGWANQVFVLDSGSTDRTREVAEEIGATVVPHPWEGHARQKNWALDHLPLEAPWTMFLDADEVVTSALRDEITRTCQADPNTVADGFYVNRYFVFMGQRIRHCGYFPSWNLRLFKRGRARYEDRPVHEQMILQGRAGYLNGLLHHEDRRGLEHYIAKHNRYSTLEAESTFRVLSEGRDGGEVQPSMFGSSVERGRFLRNKVLPHLPAKWLFRFLYMYVVKLGVMDGLTGLRFCLFISTHEFFADLKLRELQRVAGAAGKKKASRAGAPPAAIESGVQR